MRYCISGGLGFIGSNLTRRLLDEGHRVLVIDNESSGSLENMTGYTSNPCFRYLKHDICQPIPAFYDKYDFVINLACLASPIWYQKYPIETMMVGSMGVHNMLKLAQRDKARFLQASTSEIYGDPINHPQKEEYWGNTNCYGPRSCYDESKRYAESLIYEYHKKGVDTRIIRIFNTFGPHMAVDDGRVVSNFIVQALKGEPLTIYGSGNQTRSFQYIDDLLDGLLLVLNGGWSDPINIGNPNEFTIYDLAVEVTKLIPGPGFNVGFEPLPKDDPKQRCPDIYRMKTEYGWEPKIQLAEGLMKTIEYFRGVLRR